MAAKPKAKSKNKSIMSFFGKKKKEEEPVAPPAEGERPKVSFEIGEEGMCVPQLAPVFSFIPPAAASARVACFLFRMLCLR